MHSAAFLLSALLLGAAGVAQAPSGSQSYFLSAVEFGSNNESDTLFYKLRSSTGGGIAVEPDASSTGYRMRGGFYGAMTAPMLGSPWVNGASPMFIKPSADTSLTLHGTELWLGSEPVVMVGASQASVVSRSASQVRVTVPAQPVPGYQAVTFTNSTGSTRLEVGVGVLPMIDTRELLNGWDQNQLRFHASQGDFVIFGLAPLLYPAGIQIADWKHRFLLEPNQVTFTDSFYIGDADGKFSLKIPAFFATGEVHCQALVISDEPSYAPASFTNVITL